MDYVKRFRVKPGEKVHLKEIDADFKDEHESKEHALAEIKAYNIKLRKLQYLLYAALTQMSN